MTKKLATPAEMFEKTAEAIQKDTPKKKKAPQKAPEAAPKAEAPAAAPEPKTEAAAPPASPKPTKKAKKEEAPAAPPPSLVEGSLTPAAPPAIKKKKTWSKDQMVAVLVELAFKGATPDGGGYALGNVLTAEGTVKVEGANIEQRGIDLDKLTTEVLAKADELIETEKVRLATLIVQVGEFLNKSEDAFQDMSEEDKAARLKKGFACSAAEGHYVGLAEFLGERIKEVNLRVINSGWLEHRKTHPHKKGPALVEKVKKIEEASEASPEAPAGEAPFALTGEAKKKEPKAKKEDKPKAPAPERDRFNSFTTSGAGQMNAVLFGAKKPLTVEEVAKAVGFGAARVKAHLERLHGDKLIASVSGKGGVVAYCLPENKPAKGSKASEGEASKPAKSEETAPARQSGKSTKSKPRK